MLATLDPLGAMAETDAGALSNLTDMLKEEQDALNTLAEEDQRILGSVTDDLEAYALEVSSGEIENVFLRGREELNEEYDLRQDTNESVVDVTINEEVIFSSSNPWGVPDLEEEMLCTVPPDGTWDRSNQSMSETAWYCQSARPFPEDREGGILGFFTEDYRFESYWNKKSEKSLTLLDEEWDGVCLPDFSIYYDEPFAIQLWNLYRSRWLGRFWQSLGIPVMPIIQASGDEDANECFIQTLPKRAPVIAFQCRTIIRRGKGKQRWARAKATIADTIKLIEPKIIVIYGGIELKKQLGALPKGVEYVFIDSYMTKRRHRMKE